MDIHQGKSRKLLLQKSIIFSKKRYWLLKRSSQKGTMTVEIC
jgi:hypothetical protein